MANYSFSNFFKSIGSAFKPPTTPLYNPLAQKPKTTVPSAPISGPMSPYTPQVPSMSGDSLMGINAPPQFSTPTVPQVQAPTAPAITPTLPSKPPALPTISPTPTLAPAMSQAEATAMTGLPNPSNTAAPAVPNISPATQTAYDAANKAYEDSLKISPEELSTQGDIDKLIESTKAGYRATSDQPIPMEFITGQLASIERRATGLAEPLERKLARIQAARTASLEASKFKLTQTSEQLKTEREAAQKAKEEVESARRFGIEQVGAAATRAQIDKKFEEDKRQFGLDYAIKQREVAVKESEAATKAAATITSTSGAGELKSNALTSAQDLLTKFDAGKGTSAVGKSGFLGSLGYGLIPGTARSDFITQFNNLKSLLSLENVKYLKGQGQVSDAERKLLAEASAKLELSQSEPEFRAALKLITDTLGGAESYTVSGKIYIKGSDGLFYEQ